MTDAVEDLYRAELRRVVRLAFLLTGNRASAEEVAQEAFVRLLPKFSTVRDPAAYLTRIVVNLCRDLGRRDVTAARHASGPAPEMGDVAVPRELDEVWLAVQRLPHQQREAVVLRYWADLSTNEVAKVLGTPRGTTRSALHRALTSLKGELADER